MFVVVVDIEITEGSVDAFMEHMMRQARTSLKEEIGCHAFDVCVAPENPHRIMLYEVYTDRDAFDAHLSAPYFGRFDTAVQPLMVSKTVRTLRRIGG